jgi:hypothetical protein
MAEGRKEEEYKNTIVTNCRKICCKFLLEKSAELLYRLVQRVGVPKICRWRDSNPQSLTGICF